MNTQNIPRDFKLVKEGFIPKRDAFLFFDFKNIEPRLMAMFVGRHYNKWGMVNEFVQGIDPYKRSATVMFDIAEDEVDPDQRQMAKTTHMSLCFGGGPRIVGQQLTEALHRPVPYTEARTLVNKFRKARPLLFDLKESCETRLAHRGYLLNPFGRHLRVQDPNAAMAHLIQSTAADTFKEAACKVGEYLEAHNLESYICNFVHDELMLDVWMKDIPQLVEEIPPCMIYPPISDQVPTPVEIEWSTTTWADKVEYEPTF